jgi:uncharacterized membrane protein YesL
MMNWLTRWMMREGPGIPKGLPKPTGLRLFGHILLREAWELFKLNLLIVVFSLPLVTAPAAHAAAMRISTAMIGDDNVYLLQEYRRAFAETFARATIAGFGALLIIALGLYAVFIWGQMAVAAPIYAAFAVACLAASVFAAMVVTHLMVLIAISPRPLGQLMPLAVKAVLARPLPVLGGLAFAGALWAAHIAFYPVSIFMPAVCNFSVVMLALTFAALPAAECLLAAPHRRDGRLQPTRFASAPTRNTWEDKSCENY